MTHDELVEEILERLYAKSEWVGDCLIWNGCTAGQMKYGVTCWIGKQVYVHRLIYSLHNPDEELGVIRHSCDTPRCWNIDHLSNGTTQDNTNDKIIRGRQIRGEDSYNTVLTEADIPRIRTDTRTLREIAEEFGVNPATIFYIRKGKTWKHVA